MKEKIVTLAVRGGVACYKACDVAREISKQGISVDVLLSKNAANFVRPELFRALTAREVFCDLFEEKISGKIEHIELARRSSLLVAVPATANFIAKLAAGFADDLAAAVFLARGDVPAMICPAMNCEMWKNAATQENVEKLRARGLKFVGPKSGDLACGEKGVGALADVSQIVGAILEIVA